MRFALGVRADWQRGALGGRWRRDRWSSVPRACPGAVGSAGPRARARCGSPGRPLCPDVRQARREPRLRGAEAALRTQRPGAERPRGWGVRWVASQTAAVDAERGAGGGARGPRVLMDSGRRAV